MAVFANREEFQRLGLEHIKPTHSHASQDCPICLDPLEVRPSHAKDTSSKLHPAVRIIACRHLLGKDCLDAWLQVGNTCPTCKRFLFEATDDPITQRDVNNVLRILSPVYGEREIMAAIGRIITRREKEHAQMREKQAKEMGDMMVKEQQERNSEFMMADEDFYESDEEFEFDEDVDMEGGDEDDFDEDVEDEDAPSAAE